MTDTAVPAHRDVISLRAPARDGSDDLWRRWLEKGRAHERLLRRRWTDGFCLAAAALLLGAAFAVALQ